MFASSQLPLDVWAGAPSHLLDPIMLLHNIEQYVAVITVSTVNVSMAG